MFNTPPMAPVVPLRYRLAIAGGLFLVFSAAIAAVAFTLHAILP
jgi:hypothetical protein